jgi:hypothetical protein
VPFRRRTACCPKPLLHPLQGGRSNEASADFGAEE